MRKDVKLATAALAAVLMTLLAGGIASASTITAEPAGSITDASLGKLTFAGRSPEVLFTCSFSLRGEFNTTIANGRGGSLGSITEGRTSECNSGSVTLLVEARSPWPLTLSGETRLGSFPRLIPVSVVGMKFQVAFVGLNCLYEGTVETQIEGEGPSEAVVTRLQAILANSERLRGNMFCPERVEFIGRFAPTRQTLKL